MLEILWETLLESIKLLPFLFFAYLLIEYVEHKQSDKLQSALASAGKFGFLGGAILGSLPQCCFSVAASNFYAGRVITTGTLVSVFIATSDEALPILLAHPEHFSSTAWLLGVKIVVAMLAGLLTDLLFTKKRSIKGEHIHEEICAHCQCERHGIWYAALRHTVTIFSFLFLVSAVLHFIIHEIGAESLSAIFQNTVPFHPIIAVVIGLIPNCAPSVILTELYINGTLSFGAAVAGLCAASGVGLLVLFRVNRNLKENLCVLSIISFVGIALGYLMQLFGI